ncbi:OmpA family protein [Lysobacter auxotrophicus]|uniref:OmpA family protein n=2 Tax=Lysobacter auxotrophicus TaxID=2992573 RepID=A0ABM8D9G1_9GAMM|nr:OmpA family protein [Lysobacter auxotrophicus]
MTMHTTALTVAALSLALAAGLAQAASLAPQRERTTDEAIHADHATYQATQDRIQALNDAGRPVRDYALSKAQCWLDVSFHEYTRNDRSDFPQEALDESVKLIVAMEQGVSPILTDTPLVNRAARLREDLWKRLGAIHGTPGFACAQQAVACGEVELVHAGNEFNQQQWRHAKPYIQIAEDMVSDAEAMARTCGNVEGAASSPAPMALTANVLFEFDRRALADVREHSLRTVDRALARVREENLTLTAVRLIGHADRMQGQGFDYNQALSRDRAETVKAYLIAQGVDTSRIAYEYRGDTEQVQACDGIRNREALRECLLPNRRVEVKFEVAR